MIHLLAELIENATTLSPPFTQVRVSGETVANGFAIEIEDRGLGMVPQRMQELNERLANPPDLNPANTEQLGLFVVGQLARRHGIRVMLRPSPYGGTTAVVLIPLALIVEDGPAAITSGPRAPETAGANGSYRANGSSANGSYASGGFPASPAAGGYRGPAQTGGSGMPSRPVAPAYNGGAGSSRTGYQSPGSPGPREAAADARSYGAGTQDQDRPATRVTGGLPLRHPDSAGTGAPGSFGASGGYNTGPSTGPARARERPRAVRNQAAGEADGTAPMTSRSSPACRSAGRSRCRNPNSTSSRRSGGPTRTLPSLRARRRRPTRTSAPPTTDAYVSPYGNAPGASAYQGDSAPYPDNGTSTAGPAYGDTGTQGNEAAFGNNRQNDQSHEQGESAGGGDINGLPRRVRQASLAPQLRASAAATAAPGLDGSSPGYSGVADRHAQHPVRHAARLAARPVTDATGRRGLSRWKPTISTQSISLIGSSMTW